MELISTFKYKSLKVETYFKGVRHLHVKVYRPQVCLVPDLELRTYQNSRKYER